MLQGKKIIVGISASIAAYKAILLVRLLKKNGAEVRVVMTNAAKDFVSPLVLSTFSNHPVWIDFHENNTWNNHVELGLWADAFVIAPATCNTLSKMVNGQCDNMVIATYLSARCPVLIAPAMDEDMYKHPSTQQNLRSLQAYGNHVISVNSGFLASGLEGEGRMAEPEEILMKLTELVGRDKGWQGKKVLISAGPTQEAIDPVRYISNYSSGKMGISLAEACYMLGADVSLVLGPTALKPKFSGIKCIPVLSAYEMEQACHQEFLDADLTIMAAAVADYRPWQIAPEKIKKKEEEWVIHLEKTNDILASLGKQKKSNQYVVGFALETENEEAHALEKLQNKHLDAIVLNSLKVPGAGFGTSTNQVQVYSAKGERHLLSLKSKSQIAEELVDLLQKWI
ncbi:bifunctional phosphopantothenoylcysteine decarboxylase/phosphopantothenate--cysteine ligase CoaBC [Aquirufa rosea]|uniref:Coenzyme A biosynthesis bifunctional protein CoaBC n=1 Tax=Aquirufa rosea TaxID=2509241 RepID=A0A4Q1BX62_9BACT|nr:bifunctional phosphopantothenoylcysteine decarboxylase/phosphopantothenate--cysteine ligase CoaBC [Aquirufa rosea]RXK46784.1 bifunctional phosphopantothenoylcysteine decarboxylase/phosphopantothenate--cysteine ligase CoaBC [Aquirufa rosea]